MPNVKSFSVTNLKYMKYFYELYPSAEIFPQVGGKSDNRQNRPHVGDNSGRPLNRPQVVDNSDQLIFSIPWGHNRIIIDKCKDNKDKALFFVKETVENNWSRAVLLNFLDTDLYERKGKAISNFSRALPDAQSDLALEMTKDLLCHGYKYNKDHTFRISRLRNVFVTSDTFVRDKKTEARLTEMGMKRPHSASPDIHAVVRMTDRGKDMYRLIVKNRPAVTTIDGSKYHFDWPEMQLEDYFRRFGKEAVVIKPRSLKQKLTQYYADALEAYGK